MIESINAFIKKESSAGILLVLATICALLLKNSVFSEIYSGFLHTHVEVRVGDLQIAKPLLLWVNDGLMAIFFFLIGLEVKREVLEGHLSSVRQVVLPGVAAMGGMIVPALVFIAFNHGNSFAMKGWAIPTATDIAFALGVLSLLGTRVPLSLKVFLLALAIIDDLGAIIIIALFYTNDLSTLSIIIASIALSILFVMNRIGVALKGAYILVGVLLWVSVLKSGVHATLAGVALAFMIPLHCTSRKGRRFSMNQEMEHDLHNWVVFLILPLFAFVNAGVDLRGISLAEMINPVPIGIMLGLFLGKQLGVFGFSWLAIKSGFASLPTDSSWKQLYGVSILTGIGFTMSLFVDTLAYDDTQMFLYADKLAVLVGSFVSGLVGYLVLRIAR
ncbi:sodium/proton antiporter, NhaA family [Desulfuromusa kysingii]|uniref:Na(+)/H(+) antiporter NhaA n=1 Tax=Desulfuromusa kysingii TaxID=37625 RepID=A0A1H3ZL31_9BACT|nr:Na+/H+ antiporter NhaA [Desulfuromusa kysingii]SEA24348.1 sodium/proton antiporter, NhaA family [Desulfuromusa kysingii]